MILLVAKICKDVKFWLPTQERKVVKNFVAENDIPDNLMIRVSSPIIDVDIKTIEGTTTSMVGINKVVGIDCPARNSNGNCGSCRACWESKENITYPLKVGRHYQPKKYK